MHPVLRMSKNRCSDNTTSAEPPDTTSLTASLRDSLPVDIEISMKKEY